MTYLLDNKNVADNLSFFNHNFTFSVNPKRILFLATMITIDN